MASVGKGYTFGSTEQVTNTKLHSLVDSATVTAIVNNDVDASAAILESKVDFHESTGHNHDGTSSDGTKVDLSAPNAIGGTTPADGTFDALVGTTIDGSIGSVTPAAIIGTTIVANTSLNLAGDGAIVTGIKDEDDMASDSAVKLATQQSIKKYHDSKTPANVTSFLVTPASSQLNLATGQDTTVIFGTEIFDVGGNFASNTFTAPTTGYYLFTVSLRLASIDTACTVLDLKLITSNRTHTVKVEPDQLFNADAAHTFNFSVLTDMDATDTAYVAIDPNDGGTQTDVIADGSWFSGNLM